METASTEALTLEHLGDRAIQKREDLGLTTQTPAVAAVPSAPRKPGNIEVDTWPANAQCKRCTNKFTYPATYRVGRYANGEPYPSGKPIPKRDVCDDCAAKVDAEADTAERNQHHFDERRKSLEREQQIHELLHRTGASPWEHGHATLDNYDTSEAGPDPLEASRVFLADVQGAGQWDPVRGLYLHGLTGTAKTHLQVAIERGLLIEGWHPKDILFDNAAELMARIQDTYSTGKSTFDVLERRFDAKLWILDDLGTERCSDDVGRHLTLIFTKRALRPTLISSNDAPADLERKRPELRRFISRLGPKYFRCVGVAGRDRRFD